MHNTTGLHLHLVHVCVFVTGWDNDHDDSGGADGGQRNWMVTDDTGLGSDGAQTVSDDCTSFPELHPSLSLWGETRHKGRPRCPLAALERHLLTETAALPLLFHLAVAPSISIYGDLSHCFSLPFPLLTLCHPLRGGYAEVRQWDNDSTLSTFQIRALSFSLPSAFILNPSFIDLLIFTCSHVSRPLLQLCKKLSVNSNLQ